MNMDEIAKQLNLSKKYVYAAVRRYEETSEFVDKTRSGHLSKIDERNQSHLKCPVEGKNRRSVNKITKETNQSLSQSVNRRTVFNYLKRLNYEYKAKLK